MHDEDSGSLKRRARAWHHSWASAAKCKPLRISPFSGGAFKLKLGRNKSAASGNLNPAHISAMKGVQHLGHLTCPPSPAAT